MARVFTSPTCRILAAVVVAVAADVPAAQEQQDNSIAESAYDSPSDLSSRSTAPAVAVDDALVAAVDHTPAAAELEQAGHHSGEDTSLSGMGYEADQRLAEWRPWVLVAISKKSHCNCELWHEVIIMLGMQVLRQTTARCTDIIALRPHRCCICCHRPAHYFHPAARAAQHC
jgi:hypothetical protein